MSRRRWSLVAGLLLVVAVAIGAAASWHFSSAVLVPDRSDLPADEFAAELPRWVTYFRVPQAGHTESWNVDPALYERRLSTFLQEIGGRLSAQGRSASS